MGALDTLVIIAPDVFIVHGHPLFATWKLFVSAVMFSCGMLLVIISVLQQVPSSELHQLDSLSFKPVS